MKKFTWKKLNFSDDAVHDPSTSQRPCFTEINSCMKKKNLKYIWWKRAQTDFKCWRIAPHRSWYIPMRACRRPSCRLHHKLWVPLTIMKLSWDWKSSISNLEHKCSGFQPVRAFPSRPVFRRLLSFPPCCV